MCGPADVAIGAVLSLGAEARVSLAEVFQHLVALHVHWKELAGGGGPLVLAMKRPASWKRQRQYMGARKRASPLAGCCGPKM